MSSTKKQKMTQVIEGYESTPSKEEIRKFIIDGDVLLPEHKIEALKSLNKEDAQ